MFGAVKSDWTHHFFGNACTKSGPLRFSQFSGCGWLCLFVDIWVFLSLWKIARCSVILLLPLLVNRYGISVPQMTTDTLQLLLELPVLSSFMTYHLLVIAEDMSSSSVLSGVRVARSPVFCMMLSVLQFKDYDYPSGGHEFILGFYRGSCRSISCLLYNVVCPSI